MEGQSTKTGLFAHYTDFTKCSKKNILHSMLSLREEIILVFHGYTDLRAISNCVAAARQTLFLFI